MTELVAIIDGIGQGSLTLAGHDLTNHARGFRVDAEVGQLTRINVEFVGGTHLTVDGTLDLDPWLTELLLTLGWTPPAGRR